MKVGLRCPPHVSSVEQALQFALIAQRGGGRFWLTSPSTGRSFLLAAALLGNGFPLPLGVVVTDRTRGREIARQAGELARLAGQPVVIAWASAGAANLKQFRSEIRRAGTDQLLRLAVLHRVTQPAPAAAGALSFTAQLRSEGVPSMSEVSLDSAHDMSEADFLYFDVPPLRRAQIGAYSERSPHESGVRACLDQLAFPLGIGHSTLDRVDEQEFVIGLESEDPASNTARQLLVLEHAICEACNYVAAARALRSRELFGW